MLWSVFMFKAILKFGCIIFVIFYLWLAFFLAPDAATKGTKECYKGRYEYKAYCECLYQPLHEHNFLLANIVISDIFGREYSASAMEIRRKMDRQKEICKSQLPAGIRMGEAFVDWLIGKLK